MVYRHRQLGITLQPSEVASRMMAGWERAVAEEDMTFTSTDEERNSHIGLLWLEDPPRQEVLLETRFSRSGRARLRFDYRILRDSEAIAEAPKVSFN